jgi:hypothetical protein
MKGVEKLPNERAWMRSDLKIEGMTTNEICETEEWMKLDRKWQFLQSNESLVEVVCEDAETLERLGIATEQVANRLASLINLFHYNCVKTRIHTGEEIQQIEKRGTLIEDRYFVRVIEKIRIYGKTALLFRSVQEPIFHRRTN